MTIKQQSLHIVPVSHLLRENWPRFKGMLLYPSLIPAHMHDASALIDLVTKFEFQGFRKDT